jgi:hypothetical protein
MTDFSRFLNEKNKTAQDKGCLSIDEIILNEGESSQYRFDNRLGLIFGISDPVKIMPN